MLLTRRIEFSASHACLDAAVHGEEARDHGHNFVLDVTLAGDPDPVTGMVVDLKLVKAILEREIVEPFDHRHLNHEVEPFNRVVPTPENIVVEIWRRLEPSFRSPARLHSLRLYETPDSFVDYEGR
jgi:6-pyruvoyltetrahydropterin/6-carboxytetrahydropterin synthase